MKKALRLLRNKFVLAIVIFGVYTLFLDENDIFTIITQNNKLNEIRTETNSIKEDLEEARTTLSSLEQRSEVERYAREKKLFKKDEEDVFVIFYE